jgi:hypothetical protein
MKRSKDTLGDNILYGILCILSLGFIAFFRVIITTAIKKAIAKEE